MQNLDNMPNANLLRFPIPILNQIFPILAFIIFAYITYLGVKNINKLSSMQKQFLILLLICILIPILLAMLLGNPILPHPQWLLRGITIVVPFYLMAATIAIIYSRFRLYLFGAIITLNLLSLYPYYSTYSRFTETAAFEQLNAVTTKDDLVVSDPWYMYNFIDYYYNGPAPLIGYDTELGWLDAQKMTEINKAEVLKLHLLPVINGEIFVYFRKYDIEWLEDFPDNIILVWDSSSQKWRNIK
jgi:hypothetical protein